MTAGRWERTSPSAAATRALGAALAGCCRPGDVVLLTGDLGAGKTTFAQGFAVGLGVTEAVTSPTFVLLHPYRCGPGPVRTLLHADLYRLGQLREVAELALGELVEDEAVALVEWGEMAAPLLGAEALVVTLAHGEGAEERTVTVQAPPGERWGPRRAALEAALVPAEG